MENKVFVGVQYNVDVLISDVDDLLEIENIVGEGLDVIVEKQDEDDDYVSILKIGKNIDHDENYEDNFVTVFELLNNHKLNEIRDFMKEWL